MWSVSTYLPYKFPKLPVSSHTAKDCTSTLDAAKKTCSTFFFGLGWRCSQNIINRMKLQSGGCRKAAMLTYGLSKPRVPPLTIQFVPSLPKAHVPKSLCAGTWFAVSFLNLLPTTRFSEPGENLARKPKARFPQPSKRLLNNLSPSNLGFRNRIPHRNLGNLKWEVPLQLLLLGKNTNSNPWHL